eukprot:1210786-Prymnesium_polylepis.1
MVGRKHPQVEELTHEHAVGKDRHGAVKREVLPPALSALEGHEKRRAPARLAPMLEVLPVALGVVTL